MDPKETQAHKEWGGGLNDEHGEIILWRTGGKIYQHIGTFKQTQVILGFYHRGDVEYHWSYFSKCMRALFWK